MSVKKVVVIGAGTMGNGIAHVFAWKGYPVRLVDLNQSFLEKAIQTIAANFDRQIKKGELTADDKARALSNIATATSIEEGVSDGDLIVEAVNENYELKKSIFEKADSCARPEAILASNTSSISITMLAAATSRPDRVIGMHFMNPVPVMKLVEVVSALQTSPQTVLTIRQTAAAIDKIPVEVRDYPGFVSNRVLMPMINEAIQCVYEGVATPEAIDQVMKLGMNHPMGPLALADLIGLDVCLAIMTVLYEGFNDSKYRPCPLLKKKVAAGQLGRKAGQGFYAYA
ncbi:MAG: 3-hydroxybutyryl-CoA dehydrogenase [Chlorobiales bacterium]|nr:3-hydroxybutyryl-CoA dehydrogenase [Chlorobiales bacterium]